ncbi:MAG: pyridoxamine 5'-phosphate oxidase family protein [Bryobacterales bacterium]
MSTVEATSRTTLRRLPARGEFSREAIDAILDEAFLCHIAFLDDEGRPALIPTAFGREGDWLYVHGSNKNRALRAMIGGDACLSVMLLDGFVLARSTFHHSFNYRSVIVYGQGEEGDRRGRKAAGGQLHYRPHCARTAYGRSADITKKSYSATLVVRLSLAECSAKVRTGGPSDDAEDMDWPVWAGVLPVKTVYGPPEPASDLEPGIGPSAVVTDYKRP